LGNGDGTFRTSVEMLGTAFYNVAVGDFNEDGWPDVAAPDLRGALDVLGGCSP
jgi:FG-GAP-like repeat